MMVMLKTRCGCHKMLNGNPATMYSRRTIEVPMMMDLGEFYHPKRDYTDWVPPMVDTRRFEYYRTDMVDGVEVRVYREVAR